MRFIPPFSTKKTSANDPTGGQTLDALMLRQKNLLAAQPQTPEKIASPWQGAALMANSFVNSLQQVQAQKQEAAGRDMLAKAITMRDPVTGDVTPEGQAIMMRIDPDTGLKFIADSITAARERSINEREKQELIETEKRNRNNWGPVPPEVAAARGLTNASGYQYNSLTGDIEVVDKSTKNVIQMPGQTSKLRSSFEEEEAKLFKTYLEAGSLGGDIKRSMEIVDALSAQAPQGGIAGAIASHWPQGTTAGAALQAEIKGLATKLKVPGSGAQSDKDMDNLIQTLPGLQNYPQANALISAALKAKADINIRRAAIITKWSNSGFSADEAQNTIAMRNAMAELNNQSVITPELSELLKQVAPEAATPEGGGPDLSTMTDDQIAAEIAKRKAAQQGGQ
jgi:hypothetical protein